MRVKKGVSFDGVKDWILFALSVVDRIMRDRETPFVVTSVCDGKHKVGSKHYEGYAFDMRNSVFRDKADQDAFVKQLRGELDPMDFDIVVEGDHIHIEYDPKDAHSLS